jgi:hypothetical protein
MRRVLQAGQMPRPLQEKDPMVDVFRAVIGVKAEDPEWKVVEQCFENGQQVRLA